MISASYSLNTCTHTLLKQEVKKPKKPREVTGSKLRPKEPGKNTGRRGVAYLGGHIGNCLRLADGPNQAGDVDDVASVFPQVGEGKLWGQTDQPFAPGPWRASGQQHP